MTAAMRAPTRAFLAASALSSLGNGLTFPVGALYLQRVRGLPLAATSALFIAIAIAGALASLALGGAMDRHGPRRFVVLGMIGDAVGLALFAGASSIGMVIAAGVAIGAGNGLFFTGLTPVLVRLEAGAALERAFSVRNWMVNLGNTAGALIGGALVALAGEAALTPAYLTNAATSVGLAATLAAIPMRTARRGSTGDAAPVTGDARGAALRHWPPTLLAVAVANALVLVFGMAMFEAVVPYLFVRDRAGAVPLAHVIVGASTVAIAVGQLPLGRWSARRGKARVLIAHAAIWAAAAGIGAAAVHADGAALWGFGAAYGVVFGAGECLYAAALQPLVIRIAPAAQLARFNGVLSASYSVALATGPALGFALAGRVSPYAFWAAVAAAMAAAIVLWARVARSER
ncbi:MAG TPA: MFS transporter [Kofleriaceae bacterium]|jgi:MFS family permease|nr:MFS transporter [Kofleriaceae bacterium]